MKKIAIVLMVATLLVSVALPVISEECVSYGIEIRCTITLYNTYYGGPLDPDGHGTTYLAGTEPDWIVHDDGTWEIIPSQ